MSGAFRAAWCSVLAAAAALGLSACDVPAPDAATPASWPGIAGAGGAGALPEEALAVLCSDYQSTSVGLLALDGSVLSPTVISSGSGASGLSAPLSGDVALPTDAARDLILVDSANAVLSWVDPARSRVRRQLAVSTGFRSNPKDFVALSPTKAYVPRFEPNSDPGRQPYDAGDDLLIVDPSVPAITGSIDLRPALAGASSAYRPRPEAALRAGRQVIVVLGAYSMDFLSSLESRLVSIDVETDTISGVLVLEGLHGCVTASLSPDEAEVVVSCTGDFAGDSVSEVRGSGLARVSVTGALALTGRILAADLPAGDPLGFGLAHRSATSVLVTTFGRFAGPSGPARDDALLELDLDSGAVTALLASNGTPYTLGAARCRPSSGVCFAADAGRGVIHRLVEDGAGELTATAVALEDGIGLPPRELGWLRAEE